MKIIADKPKQVIEKEPAIIKQNQPMDLRLLKVFAIGFAFGAGFIVSLVILIKIL